MTPAGPARGRWLQQLGIVTLACALAGAMLVLGWWQLQVYHAQGEQAALRRATAPPVPLTAVAPAGSAVRDGYGRSVTMSGRYLAEHQVLVPLAGDPETARILTAFRLDNGRVVPVVRGVLPGTAGSAPAPPTGPATQTGVLLPSEDLAADPSASSQMGSGRMGSVRVPALAQTWPALQTDGYVVLSPADAAAQGLEPAPLVLPQTPGRLRNGAYALQWWIFAAFAVGLGVRIARDLGQRPELADVPVVEPG